MIAPLLSGHWGRRLLGPVRGEERTHDLFACVMGQGWKRNFGVSSRVAQFNSDLALFLAFDMCPKGSHRAVR